MPDFSKGKIYAIKSNQSDKIYIGSTVQKLPRRFKDHRNSKDTTAKELFELGDTYIELIEDYPCNSSEELHKKEQEHILKNNCINKYKAYQTVDELKDLKALWYINNRK
jgi:hypothetical protein